MSCAAVAHPDLYGVGIRVGFYLLWFAILLAAWLTTARETEIVSDVLLLYILGTSLALVIQVANSTIGAVDAYIALLLVYATYYAYLPLYAWRLVTGCSPFWDPLRWRHIEAGRAWSALSLLTQLALTVFQLWFWATGVHALPVLVPASAVPSSASCPHGFFFAEVPLKNQLFIALNIIVNIVLLLGRVLEICFGAGIFRHPKWLRRKIKKARKHGISDSRRAGLEFLKGLFLAVVASLIIAAVELTIQWNGIDANSINDASTAAQLIPLVVAAGIIVRILWIALLRSVNDDSDTDSSVGGTRVVIEEQYTRREGP